MPDWRGTDSEAWVALGGRPRARWPPACGLPTSQHGEISGGARTLRFFLQERKIIPAWQLASTFGWRMHVEGPERADDRPKPPKPPVRARTVPRHSGRGAWTARGGDGESGLARRPPVTRVARPTLGWRMHVEADCRTDQLDDRDGDAWVSRARAAVRLAGVLRVPPCRAPLRHPACSPSVRPLARTLLLLGNDASHAPRSIPVNPSTGPERPLPRTDRVPPPATRSPVGIPCRRSHARAIEGVALIRSTSTRRQ